MTVRNKSSRTLTFSVLSPVKLVVAVSHLGIRVEENGLSPYRNHNKRNVQLTGGNFDDHTFATYRSTRLDSLYTDNVVVI